MFVYKHRKMNIEDFRNYCLSLPGVTEAMPWTTDKNEYNRGLLCFSIAGKWFCLVNVDEFEFCNLKCPPDYAEELRAGYDGVRPGWHMNKRHWNSVYFGSDVSDEMILELVRIAYDTVFDKLPKTVREGIVKVL